MHGLLGKTVVGPLFSNDTLENLVAHNHKVGPALSKHGEIKIKMSFFFRKYSQKGSKRHLHPSCVILHA